MSKGSMAAVVAAGAVLGGVAAVEGFATLGQGAALQAAGLTRDLVLRQVAGEALATAAPVGAHLGVGAVLNTADAAVTAGAPGGFHANISEWLRGQVQSNSQPIADAAEAADKKMEEREAADAAGRGSLADAHQGKERRDTLGTKLPLI